MSEVKNNPRCKGELQIVITCKVTSTPYFSASQNMKFSSVNTTSAYGKPLVLSTLHPWMHSAWQVTVWLQLC